MDRRLAPLRCCHQGNDLREQRVAPDLVGPHDECAGTIDRTADYPCAARFFDGHRLAGEHRFVDVARPTLDEAIDGDALTRTHPQAIADVGVFERDVDFGAVFGHTVRSLGRQL